MWTSSNSSFCQILKLEYDYHSERRCQRDKQSASAPSAFDFVKTAAAATAASLPVSVHTVTVLIRKCPVHLTTAARWFAVLYWDSENKSRLDMASAQ